MANTQTFSFGTSDSTSTDSYTFEAVGDTTVYTAGNHATVNMFPSDNAAVFSLSSGTAKRSSTGNTITKTEYIIFAQSDTGSLGYPADKVLSISWQGKTGGAPTITGTTVSLPETCSGVLKITYQTSYDVLDVVCPIASMCLLEAKGASRYGYTTLDYTYGTGEGTTPVMLKVRDAQTNVVLPDASVWINDVYMGVTDGNGFIDLGYMNPGTYSVRAVKSGYQDTDQDVIANDSFTVEA